MADLSPEQVRRVQHFAEPLAELAEHQEDRWKVETTDGRISLTMTSPTPHRGLNLVRLHGLWAVNAEKPRTRYLVRGFPQ
ncbi:hypothetical protein ABZ128_33810 [Streptomyces sp. NPDC006326]|uniref:hypothetical protein n=1 Tax=Streptomyces sp. NPDC006326 TaxID=3156752 RepID=UPI0033BF4E83